MSTPKTVSPFDIHQVAIPDTAMLDAVLCVLSLWMGERTAVPGNPSALGTALVRYANAPARLGDYAPDWTPERKGAAPRGCFKRIGVTAEQFAARWQKAATYENEQAKLPADWIDALLPCEYWPVVAQMIEDGPTIARRRIEGSLIEYAQQPAPSFRKRISGDTISQGTLDDAARHMVRLMHCVADVRAGHEQVLSAWVNVPAVRVPQGAPVSAMDTSAPSLGQVRLGYAQLEGRVLRRLRCEPGQELAAIARLSKAQKACLFHDLRAWAAYSLLASVIPRVDALLRCDVGDLRENAPLPGGGVGWMLVMCPRKTLGHKQVSLKPLGEAARPLVAYLAFMREMHPGLPDDYPLLASSISDPSLRWSLSAVEAWMQGDPHNRQRAVLPMDPNGSPYLGFAPHRLRAAGSQALESQLASDVLASMPGKMFPERLLSSALKDHSMRGDMGAVYNELLTTRGKGQAAGQAISVLWQLITTQAGEERVPDAGGLRSNLRELAALEEEKARLQAQMHELSAALEAGEDPSKVTATMLGLMSRSNQIAERLAHLKLDSERIRSGVRERLIPLSQSREDTPLEEVVMQVQGGMVRAPYALPGAVRDWVTLSELALLAECSMATVLRWLEGKVVQGFPAPFDQQHPPLETLTPKRRRLLLSGIDAEWLDTPRRKRLLAEIVSQWPNRWGPQHCQPHAMAPAARRSA